MALTSLKQNGSNATISTVPVKLLTLLGLNDAQLNALAGCEVSVLGSGGGINVRYDGGGTVSAGNGIEIAAGTLFKFTTRTDVMNCLMVRSGSSDAVIVPNALVSI